MAITLSSGLTITIPSKGDTNWENSIRTQCFQKISEHDHTGGGKGLQIGTNAFANDSINDAKIRLRNNNFIRSRNAANSADINILKVNANDLIEFDDVEIILSNLKANKSFTFTNNTSSATNITSLSLDSSSERSAVLHYEIFRDGTADLYEAGTIQANYNGSSWDWVQSSLGDVSGFEFSITSGGQFQYTSTDNSGSSAETLKYQLIKV
jgi:hypothetical protein